MGKPNDLLKTAREQRNLTQIELAELIGCPTSVTVSRWEIGATIPGRHYRDKICALFGKTSRELGLLPNEDEGDIATITTSSFFFNERLLFPEEMYGRKRESEILLSRTARKASTSITGERRIGKTWLLHYLRLVAAERLGARFRLGYLDGMSSHCQTINGFVAEALRRLDLPIPDTNDGLISLDNGIQEMLDKKLIPVLCIDEFERFADRPEFTLDFFEGLRAMTQTSDLVLVIASKNPLHLVVGKNAQGSPFFNIFERLMLKPFSYTEAEQFIHEKSKSAGFLPQERDYLWKYGRENEEVKTWTPLRLQLAGKILSDDLDLARRDPDYRHYFEEQFQTLYEAVMY